MRKAVVALALAMSTVVLAPGDAGANHSGCVAAAPAVMSCSYTVSDGPQRFLAASNAWSITVSRGGTQIAQISGTESETGDVPAFPGDFVTVTIAPGGAGAVSSGMTGGHIP